MRISALSLVCFLPNLFAVYRCPCFVCFLLCYVSVFHPIITLSHVIQKRMGGRFLLMLSQGCIFFFPLSPLACSLVIYLLICFMAMSRVKIVCYRNNMESKPLSITHTNTGNRNRAPPIGRCIWKSSPDIKSMADDNQVTGKRMDRQTDRLTGDTLTR